MLPRSFLPLARSEAPLRDELKTIRGDDAPRAIIVPANSGVAAPRDHIDGADSGIHAPLDPGNGGEYHINPPSDHIVPGIYHIDAPFGQINLTSSLVDQIRGLVDETIG